MLINNVQMNDVFYDQGVAKVSIKKLKRVIKAKRKKIDNIHARYFFRASFYVTLRGIFLLILRDVTWHISSSIYFLHFLARVLRKHVMAKVG